MGEGHDVSRWFRFSEVGSDMGVDTYASIARRVAGPVDFDFDAGVCNPPSVMSSESNRVKRVVRVSVSHRGRRSSKDDVQAARAIRTLV
jgi:hypothetical protein